MNRWRIFLAGVRHGQASPARLSPEESARLIEDLGVPPEKVTGWLADWKAWWRTR